MTTTAAASKVAVRVSDEPFPKGQPPAATTVTAETVERFRLVFEGHTCGRCSGTGVIPRFGHVLRGVCFACNGEGGLFTKRGRAARDRYHQLCGKALPALVEDLQVGDVVWDVYRGWGEWVAVTEVRNDHTPGSFTFSVDGEKFTHPFTATLQIGLDHPAAAGVRFLSQTYAGQGNAWPRWDPAKAAEIVNEVTAMPGATLEPAPAPHEGSTADA